MCRISRIGVLVTALTSLLAVMSSTAGAVTWTNTGSTAIHATGIGGTLSIGANNFSCTGTTATGTAPADKTGDPYLITVTATFQPCTLAGQSWYRHCGITLTGSTFAHGNPAVTTGNADVTCEDRLTPSGVKICHIEGQTPFSYTNPSGTNPGRVTLSTSPSPSQLVVTNTGATNCWLGTGPAHLSEQTITVTGVAGSPILTRQP